MESGGKIAEWLEKSRERVRKAGQSALCDQLSHTLEQSVNLHKQLEDGSHTHHTEESDSHGWAVADGTSLFRSGASVLANPNEYGSAEESARKEAVKDAGLLTGVFSAVMVNPFAGNSRRKKRAKREDGTPHDSMRFETKIQELLKVSAGQSYPGRLRESMKTVKTQ